MKRWNICLPNGTTLKMYYETFSEAKKCFPEATDITENFDETFKVYVERIKARSTTTLNDIFGRDVWVMPHGKGQILYWQYKDESEEWIDGCAFQRLDSVGTVYPITKTLSSPQKFWEMFLDEPETKQNDVESVSINDLKRRKAKIYLRQNNMKYWIDADDMFYAAKNEWLPTAASKEEYEMFCDSKDAVLVSYGTEVAFRTVKWFKNLAEFEEFFKEKQSQNSSLYYEVLKHGYTRKPPEDRKLIISFPYINIDKEVWLARNATANSNSVVSHVFNTWLGAKNDNIRDIAEPLIKEVYRRQVAATAVNY